MVRLSLFLAGLMVAFIGAGCATTAPPSPFKIARDEFYGKVKTIALAPMVVPQDLQNPEPVKAKFESLLAAKLQGAGFSTVPPQEVAEIWKRLTAQVGEIFDHVTGQRDEAKFKTVQEYVRRELNRDFNVDALLRRRPTSSNDPVGDSPYLCRPGKVAWHLGNDVLFA